MAIIEFETGQKVEFDGDPTPQDIEEVAASLGLRNAPSAPLKPEPATPAFTIASKPGSEGPLSAAAKTVLNIPSSAFRFAKATVEALNPIETINKVSDAASGFAEYAQEVGPGTAAKNVAAGLPKALYEGAVPSFVRALIKGDTETAQKAVVEDPVGQIAPLLLTARMMAERGGVAPQFDAAISKIASPVTNTVKAAANAAGNAISASTRFTASQATGLHPETIQRIIDDPDSFSREAQTTVNRSSIASQVRDAIDARLEALSETGKGYSAIREQPGSISVEPTIISSVLGKYGIGLDDAGKIIVGPESRPLTGPDRAALQGFIDTYGRETIFSNNAMLNAREALSKLAKYDQGTTDVPRAIARELRAAYDQAAKDQVPEPVIDFDGARRSMSLGELDAAYATERKILDQLKRDFIEGDTTQGIKLRDTAINRIANATGKGKDLLIARLEELVPGIGDQIRVLKAVEDIQEAMGPKVGTYVRAGGVVTGIATMNPYLIVGALMTVPSVAVPLLRGIGMSTPAIKSTLKVLGIPFTAANKLPETLNTPLSLPGATQQ